MAAPSINIQQLQSDLVGMSLSPDCPASLKDAIQQTVGSPVPMTVAVLNAFSGLSDAEVSALPQEMLDAVRRACEAIASYGFWGKQDEALVQLERITNLQASATTA